ncbi:hypothetical protein BIFGAL_03124 [Bifidobacterium gallicum DSM 20093 = LMG 11596]|uniref:Uncharacterized protein n=1 Tax=Bifidobacterium gallicum DSM 20093 = LMG 11596 TaxID=561180 RepID=D1NTG6_9BIFI|nr:hypothetical protein BIFGAL_03124 [Bifidobacterium gallicum DSM 20093 = LMG 11596]
MNNNIQQLHVATIMLRGGLQTATKRRKPTNTPVLGRVLMGLAEYAGLRRATQDHIHKKAAAPHGTAALRNKPRSGDLLSGYFRGKNGKSGKHGE